MLDALKVIILGIVEGITEWLPVSSTGHLILVGDLLAPGLSKEFMEMFNVVIQLGAIMAVVVLYFHKLNPFSPKKPRNKSCLHGRCGSRSSLRRCRPASLEYCSTTTSTKSFISRCRLQSCLSCMGCCSLS